MEREQRSIAPEFRIQGRRLTGYAALFGTEARIKDFTEVIQPGAFRRSLSSERDVLGLVDHDPHRLLARTSAGTLRLAEDDRGLRFDLDLPQTTYGSDVLALVESRNVGGMSFAFSVDEKGQRWDGDRRTLTDVDLLEVSVVAAHPAYQGTSVQARSRGTPRPRWSRAARYLETVIT